MSEAKKRLFSRLVKGLSKTRDNIVSGIDAISVDFQYDDDFMRKSKKY